MGEWSPSHLVVAAIAVATIIGQLLIVLTRLKTVTERLDKQINNQGEMFYNALGRLEERMDKRFVEVNQRIGETNQRIDSLRSEMNQRLSEMNEEIRDVRSEMRQLNQNHIDHLSRHHSQ